MTYEQAQKLVDCVNRNPRRCEHLQWKLELESLGLNYHEMLNTGEAIVVENGDRDQFGDPDFDSYFKWTYEWGELISELDGHMKVTMVPKKEI